MKTKGWKTKIEDESIRLNNIKVSKENYWTKHKKITLTLENDVYENIMLLSKSNNESLTSYSTALFLSSIGKFKRSKADVSMIGEVNRMGMNINQIQKVINIHGLDNQSMIIEFNDDLKLIYKKLLEIDSKL